MDSKQTHLFVSAGEHSGDRLGSDWMQFIRKNAPNLRMSGILGPKMRETSAHCLLKMESLGVMGFSDVLRAMPRIASAFFKTKQYILKNNPSHVLLIDYPGFHLRLARSLRKAGFKNSISQLVCPSVWAHGKGRIDLLETYYDHLFTILPFEEALFNKKRINCQYIGNPIAHRVLADQSPALEKHYDVGIFPGSRRLEIERNLPLQLAIVRSKNLSFAISLATPEYASLIRKICGEEVPLVPQAQTYSLMRSIQWALATSGTICLELLLHEVPTVVGFAVRPLDRFIVRQVLRIKLPFYSLPNIVANEEVFPENFGPNFNHKTMKKSFERLLCSREEIQQKCQQIKKILCKDNPYKLMADALKIPLKNTESSLKSNSEKKFNTSPQIS